MSGEITNPMPTVSFVPPENGVDAHFVLSPEHVSTVEELVIADGKSVDNIFVERQYRLLTEPLYSSWTSPSGEFLAHANVGLFYACREPPLVPDIMLSLGMPANRDLTLRENRFYFTWIIGKPPNVVIEIVSDLRGGEETDKMIAYARIAVTYYIIFDPQNRLNHGLLRAFSLREGVYQPVEASSLENVGLGLALWEGEFQGQQSPHWLRWRDREGVVIPTGQERAERLAAQLRALGIEPGT